MKRDIISNFFFGTIILFLFPLLNCCASDNNANLSDIDGGPNSRIVGLYEFNNSSEYLNFYDTFKKYNSERFLCPIDFYENSLRYLFRTEGIKYKDFHSNRYDIDFDLMNMYFDLDFNSIKITFEVLQLTNYDIFTDNCQISYQFIKVNKKTLVYYYINDFLIIKTTSLSNEIVNNSDFVVKLDGLILFLKEGIKYVF